MARPWIRKRKLLVIMLGVVAVSCVLYLWLPYRVAVVRLFFWLGGSRLMIPAEYAALDSPRFVPLDQAPQYPADTEVLGLELNGQAKAIPVKRIAWHLVVNDEVGGEPVAITFCTVTDAALAYRARCGDRRLQFAPARLAQNNLVLRDRQTGSRWQQFTGRAIEGPMSDTVLDRIPLERVPLDHWRRRHPQGVILEPSGSDQDCCAPNDTCPVMSYFPSRPFLLQRPTHDDPRLPRKQIVVGMIAADGQAAARPAPPLGDSARRSVGLEVQCYWFAWAEFHPDTKVLARRP